MRWLAWLIFFLSTLRLGWAQVEVQGPSQVYDGQKVNAIDLIGNPHRELQPFRAFVVQKAGEPYSQTKVEASIEALQKAGHFPKVEANIVPDLNGLRIDFLLEPAYYIGVLEFPGAARKFAYIRLLQVANLPDEDPYDSARLSVAVQALQTFFKRNGYFEPATETTIQIDDAHQLVNVIFRVKLGRRARIGTVVIQGANPEETARLKHAMRSLRARFTGGLLKPGETYTEQRIKNALAEMKRSLTQQHQLTSSVEEIPPQYHARDNLADVTFKVKLGPIVTVRTSGAKLTWVPWLAGREMKKLVPIYSERSIDTELVQEGQQDLIDHFQKKGFFDVSVKVDRTNQPDRIALVYEINRGRKYKVARVLFTGNKNIAAGVLASKIGVKKAHFWNHGSVSNKLLRQSVDTLKAVYRDKGYEEAKITSRVTKYDSKIDVGFDIVEGPQTVVANINVTGNEHIPRDELAAPKGYETRAGQPFSPRRVTEDRNRIAATYLDRGYPNVEVTTKVTRQNQDPHRVDVTYTIAEHQFVRVGDVVYLGQKHTRLSLIRKTAKLPTEAPLKQVVLLQAQTHLYDLNIFDWLSVATRANRSRTRRKKPRWSKCMKPSAMRSFTDLDSKYRIAGGMFLPELWPCLGCRRSAWANTNSRPARRLTPARVATSSSIAITCADSGRLRARRFCSIAWTSAPSRLTVSHTCSDRNRSSITSFSIEHTTENPLFGASLGDASVQVEHVISRKKNTRVQLRYDFNKTILSQLLVPELVLPQDRNVLLSTFSSSLIRDTRDHPLDAHRGVFTTLNFGITPTALGSSANFARFFGQFTTYKSFHSVVFANSIRFGLAKAFSSSFIPTSQLFFAGGGTTLRGFPIDEAGPQRIVPFCTGLQNQTGCVDVTVPVGGNELFILNSEIRFPLKIPEAARWRDFL